MNTVPLIAKVKFEYAQKQVLPGGRFEAEPQHVRMLVLTGKAEVPAKAPRREMKTSE